MTDIDIVQTTAQVGFPIAVAMFLLWKGYNQDQKYLEVLTQLQEQIKALSERIPPR